MSTKLYNVGTLGRSDQLLFTALSGKVTELRQALLTRGLPMSLRSELFACLNECKELQHNLFQHPELV